MLLRQLTLLTALLTSTAIAIGHAAEDATRDLVFNEAGRYAPFESRPPSELMPPAEYSRYQASLAALDCDAAETMLNAAFVRAYPQFRAVAKPTDDRYDFNYRNWYLYAQSYFNDLGLCISVSQFVVGQAALQEAGVALPQYWDARVGDDNRYESTDLESRDQGLSGIIHGADVNYPPALVELAELISRGDLFHAGDDVELMLRIRTCHLGHACEYGRIRLGELRGRFTGSEFKRIDALARADIVHVDDIMRAGRIE